MRHHKNRDTGTEHLMVEGETVTLCGIVTLGGEPEIRSAETGARVADNLCENCRQAADDADLMTLYEMADEVAAHA